MKRPVVCFSLLLAVGLIAFAFEPTIETELGTLRGERNRNGTLVWRGVPYAHPPVGDLRWRAPKPVEPWDGVLAARSFGNAALQFSPIFGNRVIGSEDCLYLNIWRPDTDEAGLPVYVWIHGGGNSIGSAHQVSDYHGDQIALASNLVFVSINYRLGPMGWMLHPSFADDPDPKDASGNYGTLDIIQALKWVQENIAAFGGDPNTVLVAGESAGALNVLSLLVSPLAGDLFSHALVQSGYTQTASPETGQSIGMRLQSELLDTRSRRRSSAVTDPVEDFREAMSGISGRRILRTFDSGGFGMLGLPQLFEDGHVLPEEGFGVFETGDYPSKVPVIIGSNQEESKLFLARDRELRRDPEIYQAVGRHLSDSWKIDGVDSIASSLSATDGQPPVFAYHFRWGAPDANGTSELPGNKGLWYGSFHSLEIPFFLGTGTIHGPLTPRFFRKSNRAGREELTAAMMGYVSSFLTTGDPANADGLPRWESWSNDPGGPKSMILDYRDGELQIRMMNQQYTDEYLRELVRASYSPEVAHEVLVRLGEQNR